MTAPRGLSIVPSAEGQRAPYAAESEEHARRLVAEHTKQAERLLERLRGSLT